MENMSHYSADMEDARELVDTAENSVVGGIIPGNMVIRLYPKWRYSRMQLVSFIKSCKYALLKNGRTCKKVYWLGPQISQFSRMLTATEYSIERTEETQEIECEIMQVRRTAFTNCAFFSPNDLLLFQLRTDAERRIEEGIIIDMPYFNWWSSIHRDFSEINRDCLEKSLGECPPGAAYTIRELLFAFLMRRTDNLINA